LDGKLVNLIHSDLTTGVNATIAARLPENADTCFEGLKKYGLFDISGVVARAWLQEPHNVNGRPNSEVLRPWLNGMDLVRGTSDTWVVDFFDLSLEEAKLFELPFRHVQENVFSARQKDRAKRTRERWWLFERDRPKLRAFLQSSKRFIATPVVAKYRVFVWIDSRSLVANLCDAIAREDDTTFGILHSRFHEAWSLRLGTWLGVGNDPRYTPTTTFETFPFPEALIPNIPASTYAADPRAIAIAKAAERLDKLRNAWLNPPDLVDIVPEVVPGYPDRILPKTVEAAAILKKRTLTNLYNERPQWLADVHRDLDAAVAAADGWPADISEDDSLAQLLELNLARAAASTSAQRDADDEDNGPEDEGEDALASKESKRKS
jgi:type II restriction/modification system DNA methylase subunit YeeA